MTNILQIKKEIINVAQELAKSGLNRGASGNISHLLPNHKILITPSAIDSDQLKISDLVEIDFDGKILTTNKNKPSSEWRFHSDIYRARREISAVIHTHSTYATSLACLRQDLPALNYMVALAGGDSVRCAKYALFGTQQLSDNIIIALKARLACLLANHGLIAIGTNLAAAKNLSYEIENLCQQYLICQMASNIGKAKMLSKKEMAEVIEKFKTYRSVIAI